MSTHASPKNWQQSTGSASDFANGFAVVFNDNATGLAPTVSGTVTSLSMSFDNVTKNITLGTDGTGIISGSGTLAKTAAGGLTINTGANTFSGGTTVSAGTLTFGADTTVVTGAITQGPLGTGTINLNGGALNDNGSTRTIANAVTIGGNAGFAPL